MLRVKNLAVHFPIRSRFLRRTIGYVRAVDGVSFTLAAGETFGLVGESGCGKTTTGHAVLRLKEPTAGQVLFRGHDITGLDQRRLRQYRREMQLVMQDPFSSLSPRMTVRNIIAEPLRIHGNHHETNERTRVAELLELVGLHPDHVNRFPHEFSGGQRQRIGIARALALDPKLLVLDEPVSSLDVSIQAQIINLLERLQDELSLTYLFIAHDLAVIKHMCDNVAVMYLGKIVETGTSAQVYSSPTHPYTQALLSAIPIADPALRGKRQRIILQGDVPSAAHPPSGCAFRTRCWKAQPRCAHEEPALEDRGAHGHPSACFFPDPSAEAASYEQTEHINDGGGGVRGQPGRL